MSRSKPVSPPDLVERLRRICLALVHAQEATSYGNPAFKAGRKPFAVLDHYKGAHCVWFLCPSERRAETLEHPGCFPSPYDPKQLAVCALPEACDDETLGRFIKASFESAGGLG